MEKHYFGTDGVRDVANRGHLKAETILRLSQALGEVVQDGSGDRRQRVCLGGDTRISLDMIRAALIAGFTSMGSEVTDFGVLPTPALAYLTRLRGFDLGIMISASHNPMADNGIKVFGSDGFKIPDEMERRVEQRIENRDWSPRFPTGSGLGCVLEDGTGLEGYMTHLLSCFKGLSLDGLKVALDCANGAACRMAPEVLTRLGAKLSVMANDPDGTNINLNCGSVHPGRLADLTVNRGCHLGVALDGDGDRAVFVDGSGRILNGDHVLTLLALSMKDRGRLNRSRVVATVMSNIGLDLALRAAGIAVVRTPVGDRHVAARLLEEDLSLGGEQSGHILFGRENHCIGDGVFTALRVMEVMEETGRSLDALASPMTEYPQILLNVKVSRKPPLEELEGVMEKVREAESALGAEGRVILRYSGTERLARIMVEGSDHRKVKALARSIADAVRDEIG